MNDESMSKSWFTKDLLKWSENELREFPWRKEDISRYEMLIAEFFLARTRAEVVADVYEKFIEEYPDLKALEEADEEEISQQIEPLGLQNRRAKPLKGIAEKLDEEIPSEREELLKLPRIGPYSANATLCFGEGEELGIVDRNVDRVYRRVFKDEWPEEKDEQYEFASQMLPSGEARRYNLGLLDFASEVCTASNPSCEQCFGRGYCTYYSETGQIQADGKTESSE